MKAIGIDLGSRFVKIAVKKNDTIEFKMYDTVDFYKNYITRTDNGVVIDIKKLGISADFSITATGYGKNLMNFCNAEIISEIKAHFRGALKNQKAKDFILIDIGGQDSKVIFARNGYIEDFLMNDKCAASTGRFAENAATVLGITLDELALMTENPSKLSSTCAVFCESELIGLLASGEEIKSVGAGVNKSMAKKLAPLLKQFKSDTIFASGGAAENKALIYFIEEIIAQPITPISNPQFNGAIGCLK